MTPSAEDLRTVRSSAAEATAPRPSARAHGGYFDMEKKRAQLGATATNPFIDPAGYNRYVSEREQAFRAEWEKQKAK